MTCPATAIEDQKSFSLNVRSLEFLACRIYRNKPGVLLLSAFTGAADLMPEALIVNPYEEGRVADYLHTALTMTVEEAEVRMTALRARERQNDLESWMESFFTELRVRNGRSRSSGRSSVDPLELRVNGAGAEVNIY